VRCAGDTDHDEMPLRKSGEGEGSLALWERFLAMFEVARSQVSVPFSESLIS
jgi:hypothetical protein